MIWLKNSWTVIEETLKDVIKKTTWFRYWLVKLRPKEVTTLLPDGQEFFINQHKIATENITAEND
jgi:hypothetical protein